ncbi:hypothetical protein DFH08DRAFT_732322 [Mycena albidolilacea]|uniref:F-box domain-containing protein n=1 Tax=Mycena albidolilacea TaxID=1033008 RepID=A0AAD7AKR5_9AGAR|nr:hypothetical protein DFH08DRAFT_732322 [Mycena albidolilacea]
MASDLESCLNCGFIKSTATLHLPSFPRHLLTTNDPPTDVEVAEIRDIIDYLQARISNLDASINNVEDLLAKLRSRRKFVVEDIHRGSTILSIIRRLPADVWGQIFSYTIPDVPRRRATDRSPWVLGRVCGRWREITISLSTLWSHLDTNIPVPLLTEQLKRSKGCGLTVRLVYSETAALNPLVACSSRWETVDIQMGVNMVAILEHIHGKVPMLRRLKCSDSTGIGPCTAFQIAPNLSSVLLNGKPSLRLPWTQLKRLRQRISQIADFSQLGSARNLVELSLTNSVPLTLSLAQARGLPESILEFPVLRLLYVEDGDFLNFLVLPALEDIYISRCPPPLTSLIDRSLCRLRKITSIDPNVEIVPVLDRAPTLLEIRVRLTVDELEHLVSYLTIPLDSEIASRPPCPELRAISFCNALNEDQSMLLVQMVESRRHSAACSGLSTCRIFDVVQSKIAGHAGKMLDALRDRGTDAEWLPEKSARRKLIEWVDEYP